MATTLNERRSLWRPSILAFIAFFALVFATLPVVQARAAEAPPAGTYTGDSTAYNGATVEFTIDEDGYLTDFTTESYIWCGVPPLPTAWPWSGVPRTQVTAGEPFDLEWVVEINGYEYFHRIENFVINADGTASGGEAWADLLEMTCSGGRFNFTAETDGGTNPQPEDPELVISPDSVTESELADPGVSITGAKFPENETVDLTVNGQDAGSKTADAEGDVAFDYTSDSLGVGSHDVKLTSEVTDGDQELAAEGTLTVTEDPVDYDPSASVSPSSLTQSELADPGVTVSGEGFPAGAEVALRVDGSQVDSASTDGAGGVEFTHRSSSLAVGTHEVELAAGEHSASASFTVTEDPVDYDPSASVSPSEVTVSELADPGVTIGGTGFPADTDVTLEVAGTEAETLATNADGAVSFDYVSDTLGVGTHPVVLTAGELSAEAELTVEEDDPVYNPSLGISPSELTVSELADAGVEITGGDFPADTDVTLTVAGEEAETRASNGDGDVTFSYTSDSLGVGEHEVGLSADAQGASIEGSFTVIEDDEPAPETIPGVAPAEDDLDPDLEGAIDAPETAKPGEKITVGIDSADPGTEVGVWLFSEPTYLGTQTVNENGQVTVTIPAGTELGDHKIGVWAEPDTQLGWDTISIVDPDDGGGGGDDGDGDGDGGSGGDDGNGGGGDGQGSGDGHLGNTGAPFSLAAVMAALMLLASGVAMMLWRNRRATE